MGTDPERASRVSGRGAHRSAPRGEDLSPPSHAAPRGLRAVGVQAGARFAPGDVRGLFRTTTAVSPSYPNYDVTRDGQSFIMVQPKSASDQTVVVLLDWFDHLGAKRR